MKNFLVILGLLFTTAVATATTAQRARYTPFNQTVMDKLDVQQINTVAVTYDYAQHGGAISTIGLGKYLPANAVITRSFLHVDTQLVDGGTGTIALQCEDANNIKTATDITASATGALIEGESTGAASAFKTSIAARCQISIVIGGATISAGKLTAYVSYFTHN